MCHGIRLSHTSLGSNLFVKEMESGKEKKKSDRAVYKGALYTLINLSYRESKH